MLGAKKLLKDAGNRIFVNEHLTKLNGDIYFEARKLVREKKLFAAWTHNGLVLTRLSSDPLCKPKIVRSKADFPSH